MVATWTATPSDANSSPKENPSFDPMRCQKLGAIYHIDLSVRTRGLRDKTHPTGGTKFENFLVEGVEINRFTANIQHRFINRKLLRHTEVLIRPLETIPVKRWNSHPSKALESGRWGKDTVLIGLLLGNCHRISGVLLGDLWKVVLGNVHVTTHALLNTGWGR